MQRVSAVLGSALFFVVAPLVLAGFVPWWITHWQFRPAFFGFELTRAIGLMLIIAGVPGVVDSFARFALQGLGTPAPIAPTQWSRVSIATCEIRFTSGSLLSFLVKHFYSAIGASSGMPRCSGSFSTSSSWCTKNQRSSRHLARGTRTFVPMSRAGFHG